MRFFPVIACILFAGSAMADHLPAADAKYGPWWRSVPNNERPAVVKFCVNFLDLTAQEQLEVFYFNEEKTFEMWRACDWLDIHGHLRR